MNVEILCSSRELFGADRSALRLSEALISIGLNPTLVVPSHRPELGLSNEAKRRAVAVSEERVAIASSSGIEAPLGLIPSRRKRAGAADLTIFNTSAVLGSSLRIDKKIVVVREWLDPRSPRHRALAARHRLGADAVVGVSSGVMHQWRSCVPGPPKQYVIPNWLDREVLEHSSQPTTGAAPAGILCIGRFNRWKGQDALASAYEEAFSSLSPRPRLRFVGSQPGTEFDARSEALAARGSRLGWEVLPFTSDPSEHFRSSALVVVPSLQPEPFGTIILEAIAYGCRVIAFDGGGPTDMAQNFPGIVKLTPRDGPGLANALTEWWDQGGLALSPEETVTARRTLESHYSPEAGAASWKLALDALAF